MSKYTEIKENIQRIRSTHQNDVQNKDCTIVLLDKDRALFIEKVLKYRNIILASIKMARFFEETEHKNLVAPEVYYKWVLTRLLLDFNTINREEVYAAISTVIQMRDQSAFDSAFKTIQAYVDPDHPLRPRLYN